MGELRAVRRAGPEHPGDEAVASFALFLLGDALARRLGGRDAVADPIARLIGATPAIRRVHRLIRVFSRADLPLLILGERGTGKGMAARLAHDLRGVGDQSFFAVNCSAVPEALAESALFGHRRGAFTGAHADRDGLLLAAFRAHGGLLLDDVAEFPAGVQPKLLSAIEDRAFYPVGSDRPVSIRNGEGPGLRIYATSQPAALARLRPDLRDRLTACVIELPPLRERGPDVLLLTDRRLEQIGRRTGVARSLDRPGRAALLGFGWPGNVRQLHNVLDRAAALVEEQTEIPAGIVEACIADEDRLQRLHDQGGDGGATSPDRPAARFPSLRELESRHIRTALEVSGGNVAAAARLLGLKRTTLQSRLRTSAKV
jgi:transcriptional regulator with GAF, ATPase, and Fis domain